MVPGTNSNDPSIRPSAFGPSNAHLWYSNAASARREQGRIAITPGPSTTSLSSPRGDPASTSSSPRGL